METRARELENFMKETKKYIVENSGQMEEMKTEMKQIAQASDEQGRRLDSKVDQLIQGFAGGIYRGETSIPQGPGMYNDQVRTPTHPPSDGGGNFFSFPRIDFSHFDGSNPRCWVKKCERYFYLHNVVEVNKIHITSIHLDGKADSWFLNYQIGKPHAQWPKLVHDLCARKYQFSMGDHLSPSNDFHNILGVSKSASVHEIGKAYKSLVMRWHPDKNKLNKREAEDKIRSINEAYAALKAKKQNGIDIRQPSAEEPTTPRASYQSMPSSLSKSGSKRSQTPTRMPTMASTFSKSASKRSQTPQRSHTPSMRSSPLSKSSSIKNPPMASSLPKSSSRRSTTPIHFSQSTVRRKPPPIERKLECTLEELSEGCVKKIKITRDVITDTGLIVQEEELLRINIKPGWKKGTKITFEGMGDERPGTYPADITFIIDEKRHSLFKRDGDDLVLAVEITLIKALTGSTLTVPLLGGEKMSLTFSNIIYPGYEKVISCRGMPNPKEHGKRGDLRIKFKIIFPTRLSNEQRSEILDVLQESS